MKKVFYAIAMVAFLFCSCEKEETAPSLVGTWGLTQEKGRIDWGDGDIEKWNDEYNPKKPEDGCLKFVISHKSGNEYSVVVYLCDEDDEWEKEGKYSFTAKSGVMEFDDDDLGEWEYALSKDELNMEKEGKIEKKYKQKIEYTFERMND